MAVALPTAVVTKIIDIVEDPADAANKILVSWEAKMLFMDLVPLQEQFEVSMNNTATKTQIKNAVNAAMVASALDKGKTLTASRIFTISDIAG